MTNVMISPPAKPPAPLHFIGRQPILNRALDLYGHELLFRSGAVNEFSGDPEIATKSVIDNALFLLPPDNGQVNFINCTRETLLSGVVTLLPPESTVLEILETVEADTEILNCCRSLKESGYRFAMDDFSEKETSLPFLEIAEFIKIDFMASNAATRKQIYAIASRTNITIIAEKIETEADVELAWSEGCTLFQGYFFCKPIMTRPRVIPQNQLVYIRLLAELTREPANLREIESLTMSDPSICYRLLRLANSALYALPSSVESIRSAVMMIGDDEFRKLVTIALANVAATSHSRAATRVALERAKFCETLSAVLRESASTLYLLGMLSLMDVILNMPMRQVVNLLPLHQRIKSALLGERSPLTVALDLVRAREAGGWIETTSIQESIGLSGSVASRLYSDAIQWADAVCRIV
jgi:EAL and modified HD-GYP domain-containing signal transduction protein